MGNESQTQPNPAMNVNNQSNLLSEEEIVEIEGKIYKRVQIENQE